jgi:hypothetical protein
MKVQRLPANYERHLLKVQCLDDVVGNDIARQARATEQSARFAREYEKLSDADFAILRNSAELQSTFCGVDWDVIMTDAKDRIQNGRRDWSDQDSLVDFMREVMQSIGRDHRRRGFREVPEDSFVRHPETGRRVGSASNQAYDSIPAPGLSPEDHIWWTQLVEAARSAIKSRADCQGILDRILSSKDLRGEMSEQEFETAMTHFRRKMKGLRDR